jgi:ATP-dependent Lon protease
MKPPAQPLRKVDEKASAVAPAQYPRKDYKSTKNTNIMSNKIIVAEQGIINTYSKDEQYSCEKYFEYKKMVKENPKYGYKRCAKLLCISQGRTRWWHTKGKKKAVPLALKVVQKLKEAKLLPFTETHKDARIIFNMLGVLFGDGGVDKRLNTVAFISSDIRDINLWKSDFEKIFPFAKNKIQVVEGGEYGHSYNIRCWDRAVIRFFVALGAPVGDKVVRQYTLPKKIFNMCEDLQRAFVDGYLAAEGSVPEWRLPLNRNSYFANFSMGVSKIIPLEKEHLEFLCEVAKLFNVVGLKTGKINKNSSAGRVRKDGHTTINYRILISTNYDQILYFNEFFELRYARDKKERLEKEVKIARGL